MTMLPNVFQTDIIFPVDRNRFYYVDIAGTDIGGWSYIALPITGIKTNGELVYDNPYVDFPCFNYQILIDVLRGDSAIIGNSPNDLYSINKLGFDTTSLVYECIGKYSYKGDCKYGDGQSCVEACRKLGVSESASKLISSSVAIAIAMSVIKEGGNK